ncbi:MAG: GspH/FimT family pseudopilin [Pseudomonadales bacterium]
MTTGKNKPLREANSGFTVVELLVALAIAAVLMGFALPAFNGFVAQRDLTARVNDFILATNYARSEASRVGGLVSVQAIDASDGNNEWGPGFCVVQGDPGNCNGARLRTFDGYGDGTLDALGGLNGVDTVGYNSRGLMTVGAAGTMQLCNSNTDIDPGRLITMSAIGRGSVGELVCHP